MPKFTDEVQDIMVNIAQWRQALYRPPTGLAWDVDGHLS